MPRSNPWLTVQEAAALLRVDTKSIYRHLKTLPVRRVGRTIRINRDALIEQQERDADVG